jgi:uncharacterized protein YjbJ (UPF0337 family)
MGDKSDQVKGRVEEAVGALTDDKDLKRQGREDRLAGQAKEKLEHAKDKIEDVIDAAKDKLSHARDKVEDAIDKTKDSTHRK